MGDYGNFANGCRDTGNIHSTLPVCYLFDQSPARGTGGGGWPEACTLTGISLSGDRNLANLGSILLCGIAIAASALMILRSERKKAAVGRREMQLFLIGYAIISLCEIFTVGGFPLGGGVRRAFVAVHIAAIIATAWILMLNGIVGYQLLDDGTPLSLGLILLSAALIFIGTGYIALDTGFSWTGFWDSSLSGNNRSYSLYTLYLVAPLVFVVVFFLLETFLVLRILGERKPMMYLVGAALLFGLAQIFQFVVSVHICKGTDGKINGGMFETLFTLLSVVLVWVFWSSITEDDWPMPSVAGSGAYS